MFILMLSAGIFLLTSDFDSYILKMNNWNISLVVDNQDTENSDSTDSVHHGIEDLFPAGTGLSYFSEIRFFGKIGFIPQIVGYRFSSQIWQPPKLS